MRLDRVEPHPTDMTLVVKTFRCNECGLAEQASAAAR